MLIGTNQCNCFKTIGQSFCGISYIFRNNTLKIDISQYNLDYFLFIIKYYSLQLVSTHEFIEQKQLINVPILSHQNVIYLKYYPRKLNHIFLVFILVLAHRHTQFQIIVVMKQRRFLLMVSASLSITNACCCQLFCWMLLRIQLAIYSAVLFISLYRRKIFSDFCSTNHHVSGEQNNFFLKSYDHGDPFDDYFSLFPLLSRRCRVTFVIYFKFRTYEQLFRFTFLHASQIFALIQFYFFNQFFFVCVFFNFVLCMLYKALT